MYEKQEYINENYSPKDLCNLVGGIDDKDFKLMSEQGVNSKVYKLIHKYKLAIKVVKTDAESKNEYERYAEFSPFNPEGPGLLNFPVVFEHIECEACNPKKAGSEQCTMFISELYDGSLFLIKKEFMLRENKIKIISMLIQVIIACLALENKGLVHGDLHTGNILYKNVDENSTLEYSIEGEEFEIGTYGKLWVLWDFGNMVENGKIINLRGGEEKGGETLQAINTVQTDIEKLSTLLGLRNREGFAPLVKIIDDNGKCRDLLICLIDLYKKEIA